VKRVLACGFAAFALTACQQERDFDQRYAAAEATISAAAADIDADLDKRAARLDQVAGEPSLSAR
jgi:hypothetical protein